ncbi:MAG: ribose 5-phosphate isomerase B [Candidatus Brocadiia bacterium]
MKIAAGWDHRGWMFRERLERAVRLLGHEFVAMGATTAESSDYPDFAFRVAEAVSRGEVDRGVLVCGTGIGMSIAANKVAGIRAGVVYDERTAVASRSHNDTNVLCLAEDTVQGPLLDPILKIWLGTPAEAGRHARRVDKIMEYERRKRAAQ